MSAVWPITRVINENAPIRQTFPAMGTAGVLLTNGGQGRLYHARVVGGPAGALAFVQIFDTAVIPVADDIPIYVARLPAQANGECVIDLPFGLHGLAGLGLGISSTQDSFTPIVTDDATVSVQFSGPNPST